MYICRFVDIVDLYIRFDILDLKGFVSMMKDKIGIQNNLGKLRR